MTDIVTAELPERSDVTPEIFSREILPAGQPVVMRGLVRDWPAVDAAADGPEAAASYLMRFDRGQPVETIFGDPRIKGKFFYDEDMQKVNFSKRAVPLGLSLDAILQRVERPDDGTIYIQSVETEKFLPGFAAEHPIPHVPDGIAPRIWIGNQLTVQTHFDLSQNIAGVIAGRRRFTLFPPEQLSNLYVGPFELTLAGPPISMVRLDDPDYDKYPRFCEALKHARSAVLEPGDAIYIPYFWWHHVESLTNFNILLNFWWSESGEELGSPFDALLHSILAIRDLPPHERGAWEAMFNQYVFEHNGSAVAHLPEHAQGALGPHSPDMKRRLWVTIAQAIGRTAALLNGGGPKRR
ncbi:cupin-like domain-containing protein [Parvularcula marina]|uniref:Cupin-like domain-containing protein n=1 Tax=Parvularcula marina TaxID=2292771 RepID=A0A371RFU2_9PROT|nr:cupin-like domain-containing protein [Parvularcula marina]RFB04305.1 cupin-like domain-containing protein [Parvularcula marina]